MVFVSLPSTGPAGRTFLFEGTDSGAQNKSPIKGDKDETQDGSRSPEARPKRFRTGLSSLFRPSSSRSTGSSASTLRASPEPPGPEVQSPSRSVGKSAAAQGAESRPSNAPTTAVTLQPAPTFSQRNAHHTHLGPIELCSGGENPNVE
jgi:hypothetical protein